METILEVKGMHCKGCERTITNAVLELNGVSKVKVDYVSEKAIVAFDDSSVDMKSILATIEDAGYKPSLSNGKTGGARKKFLGLF